MVPEIMSRLISALQGAMYQGNFSYIIEPKLGSAYNIIVLVLWILVVGIYDDSITNINHVQSNVGELDPHTVS